VNTQAGQNDAVNETSGESTAQDDDFQEIKKPKRHMSGKKSTKPVSTSAAVKLPPKAVLTRNVFAPLRPIDMNTEYTGTENLLPEQKASRKSGRPQSILMFSTTNLIRLQRDLKSHVKGQYEFRNTRNGTRVITK
jgi:hypothetical protein